MTKPKTRRKVVRAWVILTKRGNVYVAVPKSLTKKEIRLDAREPDMPYRSIKGTITYSLPAIPRKKRV